MSLKDIRTHSRGASATLLMALAASAAGPRPELLIRRLEKAQAVGTAKAAVIADLKQWAGSMQPQGRPNRNSQARLTRRRADP